MSYFDDQEDAWFENDCKGNIEDYDPFDPDSWPGKRQAAPWSKEERKMLRDIEKATKGKGLKVQHCGSGHFQIRAGRRCVNYYPLSRRRIAYANDSGDKKHHASIEDAVAMALTPIAEPAS